MKHFLIIPLLIISIYSYGQVKFIPCNDIKNPADMLRDAAMQQWKEPPTELEVTEEYIDMNRKASAIFFRNMTEFKLRKRRDYELYLISDRTRQKDRIILADKEIATKAASAIKCLIEASGNEDCEIIIKVKE